MSPPPRRLTFAVSTSLLTASLSLGVAGCDSEETVNPGPSRVDDKKDDGPKVEETVNVGPEEGVEKEPLHVNEGPEPKPEPEPQPEPDKTPDEPHVNVVAPDSKPEPVEPKRVNTRPDSPPN